MRLILVRHGQTHCNVQEIWHGWDDCDLTDEGVRQAQAAGERLACEPLSAVYSSDIPRALQTAQAIADFHHLVPILDRGLRERNAGGFGGIAVDEVVREHPNVWEDRAKDYWGWRPPEGESLREVLDRSLASIDRMRRDYPNETVVAVTHMATKRVLISHLARIPMEHTFEMEFPSTGVSIFRFEGLEKPVAEVLNDAVQVPIP
jgi:broad specificity phosphatase PhoE